MCDSLSQLVRWVEDIASRRDVAPADLPLNDLSLSREDSDKYTALTGIPPNLIRFRVAVMQVLNERLAKMLSFIDFVEEEDVASGEVSAGAAAAAAAFDSRFVALVLRGCFVGEVSVCFATLPQVEFRR